MRSTVDFHEAREDVPRLEGTLNPRDGRSLSRKNRARGSVADGDVDVAFACDGGPCLGFVESHYEHRPSAGSVSEQPTAGDDGTRSVGQW
jgi:hypothetical protein